MKNIYKLISLLLTVIMILSTLSALFTIEIFAEDAVLLADTNETENKAKDPVDHINQYFATPEEKIEYMDLAYSSKDASLYVDKTSGEVAYVNNKTGEKLFTNPYDVASSTGNATTKYEILSQIIVTFTDGSGQERIFTSFEQAAERGQIVVENIKGGIRVEYTIGREQSKMLVPRLITWERFEEMIIQPLYEIFGDELYNPRSQNTEVFDVQKILSYFMVYAVDEMNFVEKGENESDESFKKRNDAAKRKYENTFGGVFDNLKESDAQYARALKKFPIVDTENVVVFDPDASEKELTRAEEIITKYCPEYTYEELEYDHILTEYKSDDANPPVFRMALEYKVEEDGLSVRLPANGIRFNESLYTLEYIEILPYMGAGNSAYEGYNFFPDGSGTLFDFQNLNTNQTRAVSGKVYGTDFAYHEITGTYQKTIRYPVFGIVEETVYYTYESYDDGEKVSENKISGNIVEAIKAAKNGESVNFCNGQAENLISKYDLIISAAYTDEIKSVEKRGFVCIIEEGDALASLTTYHAGALSDYNTVKMQFTPRPKDSYNISDSISVGSNSEWTVVSDRKYVGNYSMKYVTLSDADAKAEENIEVYDASWFGMAVAYRDYLTNNGIISKLTDEELTKDIPLYIETFGAIETTEKILSIPVTVMAPLTTFDNVEEMYDALAAAGMKNINFKLTGYANGGMWYTMPGKLKFEKAVGGNDGFQELLDKANDVNKKDDSNMGIFPDFDFAYMVNSGMFDGHSALKHNAQTIDGRYASRKEYSATQQKYVNYYEMAISPAYFAEFYEKLTKNYADKYKNVYGISVASLGTALNSDFDEDEPYNREDSKEYTVEAFKYFQDNYGEVMTNGGNAYTWRYVDHILGVSLDSSRYNFASEAVPFVGVVLHGSIRFAGDPLNMEGDLKYAMLKAIENGASPYFVLSYQNTAVLKEDVVLSKYYSIRYDIWGDDIYSTYSVLNNVLSDVQDKYITGHEFLSGGTRIPDSDELMNDILLEYEFLLESHRNAAELLERELERAASIARENGRVAEEYAAEAVVEVINLYTSQMRFINNSAVHTSDFYNNVSDAYAEYRKVIGNKGSEDPELKAQYDRMTTIYEVVQMYNKTLEECQKLYDSAFDEYSKLLGGKTNWDYKEDIESIYSDYANENISKGQIAYNIARMVAQQQVSNAISEFSEANIEKADLMAVIEKFGASCIDTLDFDEIVMNYVNGDMADMLIVEAADAWSTAQKAATQAESALTKAAKTENTKLEALNKANAGGDATAIEKAEKAYDDAKKAHETAKLTLENAVADAEALWADFEAALQLYFAGELADANFEGILSECIDGAYGTKDLKTAIDTLKKKLESYKPVLDAEDVMNSAKEDLDAAKKQLEAGEITQEKLDEIQKKYDDAKEEYDELDEKYETEGTEYNTALNKFKSTFNSFKSKAVISRLTSYLDNFKFDDLAIEKIEELEAKLAEYESGITSDDLDVAINLFEEGDINEKKLNATIGMYAFASVSKDDIIAKANALKTVKAQYETARNNYILEAISEEDFNAAQTVYDDAKTAFNGIISNDLEVNNRLSAFKTAVTAFSAANAAYEICVARKAIDKTNAEEIFAQVSEAYSAAEDALNMSMVSDMDMTVVDALVEEYIEKADTYNMALAADDALAAVIDSGFKFSFSESYEIYYNMYSKEIYKNYGKLLKNTDCSDEDREAYYKYYDANAQAKNLTDEVKAEQVSIGRFDNYLIILAEYNYMSAHRDQVTDEEFTRQENFVNQARRNAVTNTAAIGALLSDELEAIIGSDMVNALIESTGADRTDAVASTLLEQMKALYDNAREHVVLAEAAIAILAESENNYQIKYLPGAEETLLNIDLTDENMPFVVKQAVERAQAAYYYIEEDRFVPIVDGFATEYEYNGQKVYQSANNSDLYYYGTYEEGYQYLSMVVNEDKSVSFEVYKKNMSNSGGVAAGNIIYENVEEEFGKNVYFTVVDDKMTYYIKVSNAIYVEKTPTVYDGTLFATQRDGTEIYKDGDVYYSVNEDGTYTRYTYSQCLRSCYDEVVAGINRVIGVVSDVQNNRAASDDNILDDIISRIDVNERVSNKNDSDEDVDAEDEASKYSTENIVAVTYGNSDGSTYKTIILNYNNYYVKIEYEGIVYTIPSYYFVIHE